MPNVLSVFIVILSVGLPLATLIYTKSVDVNAVADKGVEDEGAVHDDEFGTENPMMDEYHDVDITDIAEVEIDDEE